ncbi:hypothetical protein N1851_034445 [Merluccius polli]|uniref:Tyr recombinase domain-containing protein n=1 Tax=Merluccius polli TaxID=89951 RepID=A0AA47LZL1_MERPO|nr:hypothetical protein N1851_034445 [Merluccius polli]
MQSELVPTLTEGSGKPLTKACVCGNKMSGADSHSVCIYCLGLEHAKAALASPTTCEHCARFSNKTRRRRLTKQAKLFAADPAMGVTDPPLPELAGVSRGLGALPGTSWGSEVDLTEDSLPLELTQPDAVGASQLAEPDDAGGGHSESGEDSISLGSDEEEEDDSYSPRTASPMVVGGACASSSSPAVSVDLHEACKRAAARLDIEWPEPPAVATTSRYEGKRLPKAKASTSLLLPAFPECLEEATRSWGKPLSAKTPVQGGSALDWAGMEEKGFSHLPPVEPLLASHLHPMQKSAMTSASPTLPSKADSFQSSLTDKGYRAMATTVKVLNASSLLLAYQAELEVDMSTSPTPTLWDELCLVTDLCLRLHRSAVQASGRAMALMVAQERARWLNLSSLSLREKTQLLDVPVDPKGLFGPAYSIMLQRWEEKKREGEALRLCLPRRAPFPSNAPGQVFAQPRAPPPAFRIPKRQPQPAHGAGRGQTKPPDHGGAWGRKPPVPAVPPGRADEGVFKAPQTAWRSLFSALSSRPDKEREGQPSRELGGAAAVSSGHIQDLLDKGKAFSTVKVYLAAISACHIGFGDKTAGQHPLVCRFMKGARRLRPVSRNLTAPWDLSTVLDALSRPPFEPLQQVELKTLSFKTALLLALASAKRVSDIHALSVSPACMQFLRGNSKVLLKPNPAFVPKVFDSAASYRPIELLAFHSPPFSSQEQERLNALCPVRALRVYVDRTAGFRKSEQLFVSCATSHLGKPLSKQRLSHWIVEAIAMAYSSVGLEPPIGLRAHSTRGMAASWALFQGVSVEEICAAASWATPHTFTRFYRLDVTAPNLSHTVLSVGSVNVPV